MSNARRREMGLHEHWAIPTINATEVHHTPDDPYSNHDRCSICQMMFKKMAVHPEINGHKLMIGDEFKLKPGHWHPENSVWMTIQTIRVNTHTGEIWMHPFESGGSVITTDMIEAVRWLTSDGTMNEVKGENDSARDQTT